jgi:hypothetical protein
VSLAAVIAILAASFAVLLLKVRGRALLLRVAFFALGIACIVLAFIKVSAQVSEDYAFDAGKILLHSRPVEVEKYEILLVEGELTASGEKWRSRRLGEIEEPADLTGQSPDLPTKTGHEVEYSLSKLGVKISLGWDERGSEFLLVSPFSDSSRYARLYNSYSGVFPNEESDFAASRILISGYDIRTPGRVFGARSGKMAFIVTVPENGHYEALVGIDAMFGQFKAQSEAYSFSNNITSFDDARKLLLRGAIFPKSPRGVLPILAQADPVILALVLFGCVAVFAGFLSMLPAAFLLSSLLVLTCLTSLSFIETRSNIRKLQQSQIARLAEIAFLASSPLYKETSARALLELSQSSRNVSAAWSGYGYSLISVPVQSQSSNIGEDGGNSHEGENPQ